MDESATIDPAALNAPASTIAPNLLSHPSPRGTKRSRSPDTFAGALPKDVDTVDAKANKRSRQSKQGDISTSATQPMTEISSQTVQTPQIKTQSLPQGSPNQSSPQQSTPSSAAKTAVVKALPTVRDHTTDQLGPGGDEYVPRETDLDGETKVSADGHPLDGRKYKCRTFQVPNRGEKLFMLATECARVLGYRDSYLLFNKNRSLYKIIANQPEKDNLIAQEILPYSYRSRQIAIVTARSMFRQFGSRLIENGRRVRDDYWEAKARKQGFTEDDAAGEKRPGAAKAREAAAAEASHSNVLTSLPQGEIIYSSVPGMEGQPPSLHPASLAPLPMIHIPGDELRSSSYGNIARPRQEIVGPAYQDRTQPSSASEILAQASQAAEFNKQLGQTRAHRSTYLKDYWARPHEQPVPQAQPDDSAESGTIAPQHLQSPQNMTGLGQGRGSLDHVSLPTGQMLPGRTYSGYSNPQNPNASPVQQMHRPLPPQMHQGSPPMGMGSAGGHRQTPSYGYPNNQMWPNAQSQASQLGQGQQLHYGAQQQHQPTMPPPQMPAQHSSMGYPQMNQMGNAAFAGMNRSMYQPSPSPQQFNMGPQANAGPQNSMQGWNTPGSAGGMPQDWQRYR